MFCYGTNFYFLLFDRFFTGFFQVFISIYFPVWADHFGSTEKQKSLWLTGLIAGSPIGVLLGYTITASLVQNGLSWRWALYAQALGFIPTVFAIVLTPYRYFDLQGGRPATEHNEPEIMDDVSMQASHHYFAFNPHEPAKDTFEEGLASQKDQLFKNIKETVRSKMFVYMVMAISTLYFITTGIQYWISDYLQVVLDIPAEETFYFYSFTCLTAPMMGLITSGIVFSYIGGYNSPKAFLLLFMAGLVSLVVSLPAPFANRRYTIYSLMWLLFFSGSFLLPTMTGIMLNSVKQNQRTTANSVATLCYNLFGFLPAPFIYGFVSTLGDNVKRSNRYALACIMFTSIITGLFLILGYLEQLKQRRE
jgi:MFS family permease